MPLTDAEMKFLTAYIIEEHDFSCPSPAHESLGRIGFSNVESAKLFEFKYLLQEQGRPNIFDLATGELLQSPNVSCPWRDVQTFHRRWFEILPEIMARDFENNHRPEHHLQLRQARLRFWGEVQINPFTPDEAEFLDALADEIREQCYGPCLRALVDRQIGHFETVDLIERRWFELVEQGLPWPQPHCPEPSCPWPDPESFDDRFDRELNPVGYYPNLQAQNESSDQSRSQECIKPPDERPVPVPDLA
jgi:hypothetical protein